MDGFEVADHGEGLGSGGDGVIDEESSLLQLHDRAPHGHVHHNDPLKLVERPNTAFYDLFPESDSLVARRERQEREGDGVQRPTSTWI